MGFYNRPFMENEKELRYDSFGKEESVSLPVINETMVITKKVIETGSVKIVKTIQTEDQVINIPLFEEEIEIQTIPVNKFVDDLPAPVRYEGDTTIISVLKEVSVVRLMLLEEIHITKKRISTDYSQIVPLRKEEIKIERTEG